MGHTTVISYTGDKQSNLAFIAHSDSHYEKELTFFAYDVNTAQITELEEPFAGYYEIMSPWISCDLDAEKKGFHIRMFTSYYSHATHGGMLSTLNYPIH